MLVMFKAVKVAEKWFSAAEQRYTRLCHRHMMPRLRQFTENLLCPVCVNLQRFMMPRLRQFTEIS